MNRVNNKKAVRRLAGRSFRAARTRNTIAIFAIALTALLFTALFTIGIGSIETFQQETMRQSGGSCHGVFKNLSEEQYRKLREHPLIKESADCRLLADTVCNPEFLKRHMEFWYYPEYHYPYCFTEIIDGRAPREANEILVDEVSMELLGKEARAGQEITLLLQLRMDDKTTVERNFTVSGIIKADPALNVGFAVASEAYLKAHASELAYTYPEDASLVGAIRMDVNFSNSFNIEKKLETVILDSGYSLDEGSEDYIASNGNWAYVSQGADPVTLGAVAGGLLLIMITGYLIIYNIFQISVIRDIRYYGLLKTIGATGRQIRKILRMQAMLLGVMGIPAGLLAGFLVGKAFVPMVVRLTAYAQASVHVSLHPLIFAGAAAFTLFTVWISSGKPARVAAKVSPVEAVRYTEGAEGGKKQKNSTDGGRLERMALSNLGRNKKRTVLVLLSLSLAVILLNSVFTLTHSFDMDKYLKRFVLTDFMIGNAGYFNYEYYGFSEESVQEEKLTESFVQACESLDGFLEGGRLYASIGVGLKKESWTVPAHVPVDENGEPGSYWNGRFHSLDMLDEDSYMSILYGMEDFFFEKLEIWEGETDPDILREKLASGKYILTYVQTDDQDMVEEDSLMHEIGDKITLVGMDGKEHEFEILSIIKENYYNMTNRMGNTFSYYTSAEVFKELASEECLMIYSFDAEDDKEAQIQAFLENYTTVQEPTMHYQSKQYWTEQFYGLSDLVLLVGGFLSLVIGVIGVLNFVNSILTGIVTRQREFAMLQAIGMTGRQLNKMLVLEGLYYAGATICFSLVLGCIFSQTVLRILTGSMWFMRYHFVIMPMLLVFPVLVLLGILVPLAAMNIGKKESVVERLRRTEQ